MARTSIKLVREMRIIRKSFSRLARSFARITPLLAAPSQSVDVESGVVSTRRRPRLTASHRKALKLQGKYMGTMRGLKPTQRTRIKRLRAEKGIRIAIAEALRLAG